MKTEKQKMLDGDLYFSFGEELFNERQFAKEIIFDFNNLRPQEVEKRNELLKKILGSYGEKFFIEPPFRCDYGYNISIGENFYSNYNLVILDCARVTIGDNVLIGPNVNLFAAGHPVDVDLRLKEFEYAFPINIGDNVWVGGGVTINAGVNIGDGTVIASGSVVTKDIPANVVAGGNPCKVIRKIDENDKKRYFKDRYID